MRKVLLIEPPYHNKYPPMGLMKLAMYFRQRGDDVRFFKGDFRDLAVELLFEETWAQIRSNELGAYTEQMRAFIRTGKHTKLTDIPEHAHALLKTARERYVRRNYPTFDVICVTTLFTFYWKQTVACVTQAKAFLAPSGRLLAGGIAAGLMAEQFERDTGVKPHVGLLDKPGYIDADSDVIIDRLPLDYSILEEIEYVYPASNAFLLYGSRGCPRMCAFCCVPKLEPQFCGCIDIIQQVEQTRARFGDRRDALLYDNNAFASPSFPRLIEELNACGFGKGARYTPPNAYQIAINNMFDGWNVRAYVRKVVKCYDECAAKFPHEIADSLSAARTKLGLLYYDTATAEAVLALDPLFAPLYEQHVHSASKSQLRKLDFNQGLDARLAQESKIQLLSTTCIDPLRIAFDHWGADPRKPNGRPLREFYAEAMERAVKHGIKQFSSYLLYNTDEDTPEELWLRMDFAIKRGRELGLKVYLFPMKYQPITDPQYFDTRDFVGKAWCKKYIRAMQNLLSVCHGVVADASNTFFEFAFGGTVERFMELLLMPEGLIRDRHLHDRTAYDAYIHGGGKRTLSDEQLALHGNDAQNWRGALSGLSESQRKTALSVVKRNVFTPETCVIGDADVDALLEFYLKYPR